MCLDGVHGLCGDGYYEQNGQMDGYPSVHGRGGGESVSSCDECKRYCDVDAECHSYECSDSTLKCSLSNDWYPEDNKGESSDYYFCTKHRVCGDGYYEQDRAFDGWPSVNGIGGRQTVSSCAECERYCTELTACYSYECSDLELKCSLGSVYYPQKEKSEDSQYHFCTKANDRMCFTKFHGTAHEVQELMMCY